MIKSFRNKDTEMLFVTGKSVRLQQIERVAARKLELLDAATTLEEIATPGSNLEKLKGDRKGQHSIRINQQWRICFRWADRNAEDVEIVDYH
jgi:toxin HigB-1